MLKVFFKLIRTSKVIKMENDQNVVSDKNHQPYQNVKIQNVEKNVESPISSKLSNGHSPQIHQNGELLARMCRGESHFSQKLAKASVGESCESAQHGSASVGESGESAQHILANVGESGESGESAQHGLANVGESGESAQHGLANVGKSGE